jgi:hypothetical protein
MWASLGSRCLMRLQKSELKRLKNEILAKAIIYGFFIGNGQKCPLKILPVLTREPSTSLLNFFLQN